MLSVIVRFRIRPGCEQRFFERVKAQAKDTLAFEPACKQFDVCDQPADLGHILLYEVYESPEAFGAHLQTEHFKAFDAATSSWVEEKSVERWHQS